MTKKDFDELINNIAEQINEGRSIMPLWVDLLFLFISENRESQTSKFMMWFIDDQDGMENIQFYDEENVWEWVDRADWEEFEKYVIEVEAGSFEFPVKPV